MKHALILMSVSLLVSAATAATYYVSPSGNDNNAGTEEAPVKTIAKGISKATAAGDIVLIADGDYEIGAKITVSKAITIRGNVIDRSKVMVNCKKVSPSFYSSTVDGLAIEGLTFTNCNLVVETQKLLTIKNCAFRHGSASGNPGVALRFSGSPSGDGCLVEDCEFEDLVSSGNNAKGAVYIASTSTFSLTFRRCVFRDCSGTNNGGAIGQNSNGGLTLTVENCEFRNCQALNGGAVMLQKDSGKTATFRNCLFDGCEATVTSSTGGSAIFVKSALVCDNCTFADGKCSGHSGAGAAAIYNVESGTSTTLSNCIFWNNKDKAGNSRDLNCASGSLSVKNCAASALLAEGNGNIALSASPFAAAGVYTLAGGDNPCLGAGVKLDWMTADSLDLAGNPRLRGNDIVDLGCYEFVETGSFKGFLMLID